MTFIVNYAIIITSGVFSPILNFERVYMIRHALAFLLILAHTFAFAQNSSIRQVHMVRNGLYCTLVSGDGWASITFSGTPGTQRLRPAYSPVIFKKEFFTLEFQSTEKNGYWTMRGNKKSYDTFPEGVMKDCIRVLKYDMYISWEKQKPSTVFQKQTTKE